MPFSSEAWPALPYAELRPTLETLQLFTQAAGKTRLAGTPWLNHSWHVTFYVSARGLITGLIPHGAFSFDIEFDFVDDRVELRTTNGTRATIALTPKSVATFYAEFCDALASLGIEIKIDRLPNELPDVRPFDEDRALRAYDPDAARKFWRALVAAERVLQRFRTRFIGKSSPVHFFWGSFDLAVTRFSGRPAPLHPGGIPHLNDAVTREAYSHEVSSAGFWPGSPGAEAAAFYSYAYPVPPGFADARVKPDAARFDKNLGEFLLPYDAVRTARDPDAMLLDFLESTYEAAADLGKWDRAALECEEGRPSVPRRVG
ncbi:MAG: hypothetical protein JOZ84_17710 [Methylobacteriaceae bacterium]|nr:hypothetical protein [Methylobacteriaceae bacterium]MBV9396233.1 hypothetical protein [Methylobacteriaceae bacterium]